MKKKRWREVKDLDGNLLGMKFTELLTLGEAIKRGYKPRAKVEVELPREIEEKFNAASAAELEAWKLDRDYNI